MQFDDGPDPTTVRKRAMTAGDRQRLEHEADMLRAAAHPGVVQLLSMEENEAVDGSLVLVLRRVEGGRLADLENRPAEVVAGIGAAVATTLADLHDIGFSHGAVTAEHVLLDAEGRPVLCSFGRATAGGWAPELAARQRDDVRSLAQLLGEWAGEGGRPVPRSLRSVLDVVAGAGARSRRCDGRWLARALIDGVPGARLPAATRETAGAGASVLEVPDAGGATSADTSSEDSPAADADQAVAPDGVREPVRRRRPYRHRLDRRAGIGAAVLATGALLAVVLALAMGRPASRHTAVATCPSVDDGCGPVALAHGVLVTAAGRYRLTGASDVAVLGRWDCGPGAEPAVLRVSGGQVWVFDTWPATGTVATARLVARVPSALNLRVQPGDSGCDQIDVIERGGHSVMLDPRRQ